jgi:putative nucleotidyltransferase with HDIG domain
LGPGVGAVLVALDASVLCLKEFLLGRGLRREQVAFNIAAPAVSIWFAAVAAGLASPSPGAGLSPDFVLRLAAFTALYFILNSGLVTVAISLEQKEGPLRIWWANFRELWINFAAGASIAAFAANAKGVNLAFIGVIVPLLVVIYVTYSWSAKRVQVERDKNLELNRVFLSTVEALALAIDAKDQVTHGHIRRVQRYTMGLADGLGVKDEKQIDALRAAALLHDTGKLAVPEYILNKPGPLTASEFERMKVHAAVGADILKSIDFPYPVEPIVRHQARLANDIANVIFQIHTREANEGASARRAAAREKLFRRKQKCQRPPSAQPPIEFVVLVRLRFLPFVAAQVRLPERVFIQRLRVHKVRQVFPVTPANAPQFGGHSVGVLAAIVTTGIVDHAAVQIHAKFFRASAKRLQMVYEEAALFHLERS